MATYTVEALAELAAGYEAFEGQYDDLLNAIVDRQYKTDDGHRHARHGLLRRLNLMRHCIEKVFELIPPETDSVPDARSRTETLISLHSFSMNTFGCLDNLAWIWASERGIKIKKSNIGLGPKNVTLRDTLPAALQNYLNTMEEWFDNLYEFRHALVHRIPFYIPPYIIDNTAIKSYNNLETKKVDAASAGDWDTYWKLDREQDSLGKFKAVVTQGPVESRLYYFHGNMLADMATIHGVGLKVIKAIDS